MAPIRSSSSGWCRRAPTSGSGRRWTIGSARSSRSGIGGSQADAIGDEASRLAPISPSTARSLIAATRAASLMDEAELDVVADQLTRVAQLVSDHAQIVELDLNPLIVSEQGSWVVDASIRLREPERVEPAIRRLE